MKKYNMTEADKANFISMILLNEIINFQTYFPVSLAPEVILIRQYLIGMENKGLLKVVDDVYVPTDLGREQLVTLYSKYQEYLKIFDIFCAVDLENGEFAFSRINDDMSDDEWFNHLDEERFSDVRVAVADFKGINPMEIVFLSFLNENRFDCTIENWQFNLIKGGIWEEIEEICNTAVSLEYLTEEGVIENIVTQGAEIALDLIKLAESADEMVEETVEETIMEETTEVEEYVEVVEMPTYGYSYYDPYYDPYYVSPLWLVPAIIFL